MEIENDKKKWKIINHWKRLWTWCRSISMGNV
jgi:hypothetical protein